MDHKRVWLLLGFLLLFGGISVCNATNTASVKSIASDAANGQLGYVIEPPPIWALNCLRNEGLISQDAINNLLDYCQHPDTTLKVAWLDDLLYAMAAAAALEATKIIVTHAVNALVDWINTADYPHRGPNTYYSPWGGDPWQ